MRTTSLLNVTFVVIGSCALPVRGGGDANKMKANNEAAIARRR
jgi:hypothetical protein